ncbi:hypothetical protein KIPB_008361 [Kipferlia bialata]|uniref:Uncharacterized protein n=1 Tax=Kipferlia bialata TaxID=797122 RepID=A0A391NT03_9EUKA|nr:hypothetical protein KIPB_008361 [Kipferlia bialata]|eukprot:g8361.t1
MVPGVMEVLGTVCTTVLPSLPRIPPSDPAIAAVYSVTLQSHLTSAAQCIAERTGVERQEGAADAAEKSVEAAYTGDVSMEGGEAGPEVDSEAEKEREKEREKEDKRRAEIDPRAALILSQYVVRVCTVLPAPAVPCLVEAWCLYCCSASSPFPVPPSVRDGAVCHMAPLAEAYLPRCHVACAHISLTHTICVCNRL